MHRRRWQRALSWAVPVRPLQCDDCGARSWGMLQAGDGVLPWATALLIWVGLGLLATGWIGGHAPALAGGDLRPAPVAAPPVTRIQETTPDDTVTSAGPGAEPVDAGFESGIDATAGEGFGAGALAGVPPAQAPAGVPPLPTDTGPTSRLALAALDVRWTGTDMEVTLRADAQRLSYDVREYAGVRGYVIDLPGVWSLPEDLRMERTFTRSNLQRLRVGLHRDHLRLVLTLRKYPSAAPRVEHRDDGLRIRI